MPPNAQDEVGKLVAYIEENLRASSSAGFTFIDTRNLKGRLMARQNHVVFGRRGAGKSTLVKSVCTPADHIAIRINLEDYKDISFPNILLHVLKASCEELDEAVKARSKWWQVFSARRFRNQLRLRKTELERLLYEPDKEEQRVRTTEGADTLANVQFSPSRLKGALANRRTSKHEVSRTVPVDKLVRLQIDIPSFKRLFSEASALAANAPVYLVLDDFYFVPKAVQPDFIDFFHRLTKDTPLFLKVATIKHRSRMFKTTEQSYIGAELGHDIYEVDMDYTLDKFGDLKEFMNQLLRAALRDSGAALEADDLFTGDGFGQLCLASGGVPRDFLSLFVRLANSVIAGRGEKIGKVEVTEEAVANVTNKLESLKIDSAGEREILESYLSVVRRLVYNEHRTNAFLVAKDELEQFPQERQAIRELVDLRLIHLIDTNTSSAPSDGRRYEAYILDVGLYENSRPRNFNQVEPGSQDSKSRKDHLRASPKLVLPDLAQKAREFTKGELFLTDTRSTRRQRGPNPDRDEGQGVLPLGFD